MIAFTKERIKFENWEIKWNGYVDLWEMLNREMLVLK